MDRRRLLRDGVLRLYRLPSGRNPVRGPGGIRQGQGSGSDDEKTGAIAPIANPLLKTAPLGVAFAAVGTAIVYRARLQAADGCRRRSSTTLASLVFVVPYAIIVRLNIFRDIEGLAAQGAFRAKAVDVEDAPYLDDLHHPERRIPGDHLPALGLRGFSHAAAAIADHAGPGVVPVAALAPDFAITFMFVCSFTFLAVMAHTASDMFEGEMSYSGKARGINGFLFFVLILLMGVGLGIVFALVPPITGVETVSFGLCAGPEVSRSVPVRLRRLPVGRRLDGQEVQ